MTSPTTTPTSPGVAMLGLGAMGGSLAARLLDAGHPVTVWNRTAGRDADLVDRGARPGATVANAVTERPLIVACLLRHSSVHETLDPVVDQLRGKALVNLTTTTPNEARETAAWADEHGIDYLHGAILAVPAMIGTADAQVFYSGSRTVFDRHREVFDTWATSIFDGTDAGRASLIDLALLSGMYQMFAGFLHGAAMVGSEGMTATDFAARATPFISAMTGGFAGYAQVVDGGDYTVPGQQSLDFSDLSPIVRASDEQGVNPATVDAVQTLITRQVAAGHGSEGFARIYESFRASETTVGGRR
ncbi:NAD(P)-dependent oxidoreductase [Nocardia takedensis]|uniref:NAD(P)-dependent oxidoreductase n=2 Tax=Nocardia takedensis TaxID=259390 RepID=UPI00068688DE|nr:NAD(P)-binding domain-containing protein [Nocardia takedensis]